MKYVYLIESISCPGKKYIGKTTDLKQRINDHNSRRSPHTSKYTPWQVVVALKFDNDKKTDSFGKYLKSGSGHAFAKRHFW